MNRANFTIAPSRYTGDEAAGPRRAPRPVGRGLRVAAGGTGDPLGRCRAPPPRPRPVRRAGRDGRPRRAARRIRAGHGHQRGRARCRRVPDGRAHARSANHHQPDLRRVASGAARPRRLRPLLHDPLPAVRATTAEDVALGGRLVTGGDANDRRRPHVRSATRPGALSRRLRRLHEHLRCRLGRRRSRLPRRPARRWRPAETRTRAWQYDVSLADLTAALRGTRVDARTSVQGTVDAIEIASRDDAGRAEHIAVRSRGGPTGGTGHDGGRARRRSSEGTRFGKRSAARSARAPFAARASTSAGPARRSPSRAADSATASACARPAPSPASTPAHRRRRSLRHYYPGVARESGTRIQGSGIRGPGAAGTFGAQSDPRSLIPDLRPPDQLVIAYTTTLTPNFVLSSRWKRLLRQS